MKVDDRRRTTAKKNVGSFSVGTVLQVGDDFYILGSTDQTFGSDYSWTLTNLKTGSVRKVDLEMLVDASPMATLVLS